MIYCQCWLRYRPSYVYKMMWDELIFTPKSFVEKWLLLECFCTEECWRLFVDLYLCTQKAQVLAVRLWARGTALKCLFHPSTKITRIASQSSHASPEIMWGVFHQNRQVDLRFGDSHPQQNPTILWKYQRCMNYAPVIKFLRQIKYFWIAIPCPHAYTIYIINPPKSSRSKCLRLVIGRAMIQ